MWAEEAGRKGREGQEVASDSQMCESLCVLLILTATLLGNYYYSLFAEEETEPLPGCKVLDVPCICHVPMVKAESHGNA